MMICIEFISEGYENRVKHLASILASAGNLVRMHVIHSQDNPSRKFCRRPSDVSIRDYHLKAGKIKLLKRFHLRKMIAKQINQNRLSENSVIFISSPPVFLAPLTLFFKNTILDIRDTWQYWDHHSKASRIVEKYEQLEGMKHADLVTYAHPRMDQLLNGTKMVLLCNGANSRTFEYIGKKRKLPGKTNFVYCGGIDRYHGLPVFLDVMKLVNDDIHLTVVGSGNDDSRIKQTKNVTFIQGVFQQEELAEFLRSADYAISALSPANHYIYDSAVGLKTYEALCCGTPVLSLGGQGVKELLTNYYPSRCFDTRRESTEQIADHINSLPGTSRETRYKIGHDFRLNHSYQVTARKLRRICDEFKQ